MFIGHAAVGFASKRIAPRTSLALLLAAPYLADLLWPIFLLLGLERVRIEPGLMRLSPLAFDHYPWSHSLLMDVGWAALLALLYRARTRDARGAWVLGLGVASHWVLDAIVHRPDMPLWPGRSPLVGLGLWNSLPGTVALEGALFVAGIAIYLAVTRARGWAGRIALGSLVALLAFLYVADLMAPPPPSPRAIAWVGLAGWVFVPWAWWIDRTREVKPGVA